MNTWLRSWGWSARHASFGAMFALGCNRYWVCDGEDDVYTSLPERLSDTGLYTNLEREELAPEVVPYTPRFSLWSDGSEKRRWIALPEGRRIDTSDMDDWIFPEGTKLWKEFTVDGKRTETRLLAKSGPSESDWSAVSYVWNAEGTDALAAPFGASNSHDTAHDVPAASECSACHGGRRSFVLGFSAIQLAEPAPPGELDLAQLMDGGRLTHPPDVPPVVPGTAREVNVLGYLHANCSSCHNQARPARRGARCFDPQDDLDFTLAVDQLDEPASTPTYRTAVGGVIAPGNPAESRLLELVGNRGFFRQMPPLATEQVDAAAVAELRAWIEGL